MAAGKRTTTSNFGVGKRESHDASGFYERFTSPELTTDDTVLAPFPIADPCRVGDSRSMDLPDGSVALVVTSPPYFAGKAYEEELERDGIPSSYLEYLDMLRAVFTECVRVLEPGGRIAVNVANLGRKPYRSLSSDVIGILQDDLGLLLRGEIIWQKADGASGNCAWGSFRSAGNPVIRDLTERVIIASKGRFDRARSAARRSVEGLPHRNSIGAEDFMASTLDVWSIQPESATKVGHPAPFPIELPAQLISLYTYEDDLVVDPFLGSGSTVVAATMLGRRGVGYDLDSNYVALAQERVAAAATAQTSALRGDGESATALAEHALVAAGFSQVKSNVKIGRTGIAVSFSAEDAAGDRWYFDVAGPNSAQRPGLSRGDVLWKVLGRAAVVQAARGDDPLVVVTTHLPPARSEAGKALASATPHIISAVIDLAEDSGATQLKAYATRGKTALF